MFFVFKPSLLKESERFVCAAILLQSYIGCATALVQYGMGATVSFFLLQV